MRKRPAPFADERDKLITLHARNTALYFVVAVTQLLTIICLVKGNPAWKGTLSILFVGMSAQFFYEYDKYGERLFMKVAIGAGLIGAALLIWFGISG